MSADNFIGILAEHYIAHLGPSVNGFYGRSC